MLGRAAASTRQLQVLVAAARPRHSSQVARPACASTRWQSTTTVTNDPVLTAYKQHFKIPRSTCSLLELQHNQEPWLGRSVTIHGYLGARRNASKDLTFAELHAPDLKVVLQLVEHKDQVEGPSLRDLGDHVPVSITGTLQTRRKPGKSDSRTISNAEVNVATISPLNTFDNGITMTSETVFPPEQRYLQIRNDTALQDALQFRSKVTGLIRQELCQDQGFTEIETPLLFKSTPEGAREFLVPTRSPGLAYALPQSPQQYKQVLMASAVPRYMQIAKCFRDEDLRADRQPEFTQVDLEMAFAGAEDVMEVIHRLIHRLWSTLLPDSAVALPFARMSYAEAMSRYGSDKPDLRYGSEIHRIEHFMPADMASKITGLQQPVVDAFKISISDNPRTTASFVRTFMESPAAESFNSNPHGQPGVFIIDSTKPLRGLQPFGFAAADQLDGLLKLDDGDCVFVQARPDEAFTGGHTAVGNLRLATNKAAIEQDLITKPDGFHFLWIVDFPLFTKSSDSEPGQGGSAGLSATHHPFTAPKSLEDIELLLKEPLEVKADHYDLVVNGVELGGGSRRIHDAAMQDFIMSRVLRMSSERIADFSHLLAALKAGCPPHAGIALGLDRLIAVMLGKDSVRDVIAFPKGGKGDDPMVKSPSPITNDQLSTYHLQTRN